MMWWGYQRITGEIRLERYTKNSKRLEQMERSVGTARIWQPFESPCMREALRHIHEEILMEKVLRRLDPYYDDLPF